jgi:EAL domain-containing protein (putative c-di-GMP-specific phosphodiesterase class I)
VQWARTAEGEFTGLYAQDERADTEPFCRIVLAELAAVDQVRQLASSAISVRPVWSVAAVTYGVEHHPPLESLLLSLSDASVLAQKRLWPVVQDLAGDEHHSQRDTAGVDEIVRSAIIDRRIALFAQPIVSNTPNSNFVMATGQRFEKLEILARVLLPDGSIMPTHQAISSAIKQGLMSALDSVVLENAFAWFADNRPELSSLSWCSINVSAGSVCDPDFARRVEALLTAFQLPSESFCFEITESETIVNLPVAQQTVRRLRALGFHVALDDFGTGLATFDYLKRFEVDAIKIDGAFIAGLHRSKVDQAIVRSIVELANSMGLKTVAEYVASEEIYQLVCELGVHESQGFAIAKPAPLASWFE